MTKVRVGSRWKTIDKTFIVTGIVERDNHLWVHYKEEYTTREYSCYEESFIHRFTEVLNDSYGKV